MPNCVASSKVNYVAFFGSEKEQCHLIPFADAHTHTFAVLQTVGSLFFTSASSIWRSHLVVICSYERKQNVATFQVNKSSQIWLGDHPAVINIWLLTLSIWKESWNQKWSNIVNWSFICLFDHSHMSVDGGMNFISCIIVWRHNMQKLCWS